MSTIKYQAGIDGFDWDNDRFEKKTYSRMFDTYEQANEHYEMLAALTPDDEWRGRPVMTVESYTTLADLLDVWHGCVFTGTATITKNTWEVIRSQEQALAAAAQARESERRTHD